MILLGIDVGNDLGIVVPTDKHDRVRDVVYRTSRLGETAHVVDTPLFTLSDGGRLDEAARAVDSGAAVDNALHPIGWLSSDRTVDEGRAEALRSAVGRAVAGRIVQRFSGTVTTVSDEHFVAEPYDPVAGEQRVGELAMAQIPPTPDRN